MYDELEWASKIRVMTYFQVLSEHLPGWNEQNHKLTQVGWCLSQDSNQRKHTHEKKKIQEQKLFCMIVKITQ